MRHEQLRFFQAFKVIFANRRSQVAQMVIAPGESAGCPRNRHWGAGQWLFVVAGRGMAKSRDRRQPLRAGTLLFIEHGDWHEISNVGRTPLETINVHVPPAYLKSRHEMPAACGNRTERGVV